jgi:hypothetical protein
MTSNKLKSCVAWLNVVSESEARDSVPGATVSIFPADSSAMIAYGPISTVEELLTLLRDKRRGGSWEWRNPEGGLLDRSRGVPDADAISSLPAVAAFLRSNS